MLWVCHRTPPGDHLQRVAKVWRHSLDLKNRLYFLGSTITADGNCSCEIKRRLLLRRKTMTNLDNIFKSRDITLPTKVCLVQAMVFPAVMYGCDSWTIKKAEHKKLMLWNCEVGEDFWETHGLQGDQTIQPKWKSVLNIHWMLKMKLQYSGQLMQRTNSL